MHRDQSRVDSKYQASIHQMALFIISLFLGLIEAEIVLDLVGTLAGVIAHALVLLGLINIYAFTGRTPHRQVFLMMMLVPLLRIFSVVMPLPQIPQIYWYAMIGVPVLITIWLIGRGTPLATSRLRINRGRMPFELAMGMTGIPVGLSAYYILHPKPLTAQLTVVGFVVDVLILVVFSGFLEELIFRSLLPESVEPILGRASVVMCSALFMSFYIGAQSTLYTLLAGVVGLMYGLWANRMHSIWGVVLSHSLWMVGLVMIWPLLLH